MSLYCGVSASLTQLFVKNCVQLEWDLHEKKSVGKQNIFMESRKFLGTQLLEKFIEIPDMSRDYFVSQDLMPPHFSLVSSLVSH